MTEIDNQEEQPNEVKLTAYEKFQLDIEKAKESAEIIVNKALDERALRESMGVDLEGLVENLEEQKNRLLTTEEEIEEELEPMEDLDPSHPEYVQPIG
jgi:KaiC/GvpD/RAD55 family RecA-like ATPase